MIITISKIKVINKNDWIPMVDAEHSTLSTIDTAIGAQRLYL